MRNKRNAIGGYQNTELYTRTGSPKRGRSSERDNPVSKKTRTESVNSSPEFTSGSSQSISSRKRNFRLELGDETSSIPKLIKYAESEEIDFSYIHQETNLILEQDFSANKKIFMTKEMYTEIKENQKVTHLIFENKNFSSLNTNEGTFNICVVGEQSLRLGLFILVKGSILGLNLLRVNTAHSIDIEGAQIKLENAFLLILTGLNIRELFSLYNVVHLERSDLEINGELYSKVEISLSKNSAIKAEFFNINVTSSKNDEANNLVQKNSFNIVRHAETGWTINDLTGGASKDFSLNKLGRNQAKNLTQNILKYTNLEHGNTIIYTSPLKRCSETSHIIARAIFGSAFNKEMVIEKDELLERIFGPLTEEQATAMRDYLGHNFTAEAVHNMHKHVFIPTEGTEKLEDFEHRVVSFCSEVMQGINNSNTPTNVFCVTHLGVLRVILSWLRGGKPSNFSENLASFDNLVNIHEPDQDTSILYTYKGHSAIVLNSALHPASPKTQQREEFPKCIKTSGGCGI
jgi:broad specificity phosphatase PhoE